MAKPMVRELAIDEALQEEIKDTLEHNNQSYDEWYAQTDEEKEGDVLNGNRIINLRI